MDTVGEWLIIYIRHIQIWIKLACFLFYLFFSKDWFLRFVYRTASAQITVAGLQAIRWKNRKMVNVDLSELVSAKWPLTCVAASKDVSPFSTFYWYPEGRGRVYTEANLSAYYATLEWVKKRVISLLLWYFFIVGCGSLTLSRIICLWLFDWIARSLAWGSEVCSHYNQRIYTVFL